MIPFVPRDLLITYAVSVSVFNNLTEYLAFVYFGV